MQSRGHKIKWIRRSEELSVDFSEIPFVRRLWILMNSFLLPFCQQIIDRLCVSTMILHYVNIASSFLNPFLFLFLFLFFFFIETNAGRQLLCYMGR